MSVKSELKEFLLRGNVVDMAVGIIIGGAFGKIVSSLVSDVIMPPFGLLLGGINFTEIRTILKNSDVAEEVVSINWGLFIQSVFDFLIIGISIFFLIKLINSMANKFNKKETEEIKEEVAEEPAPSKEEILLSEIRDLLKDKAL